MEPRSHTSDGGSTRRGAASGNAGQRVIAYGRRARGALVAVLVLLGSQAFPCECVDVPSPRKARRRSDMVFVGVVRKVMVGDREVSGVFDRRGRGLGPATVTFQVASGWKGPAVTEVSLETGPSSCGAPFDRDLTYLVFAARQDGRLKTDLCAGNWLVQPSEHGRPMRDVVDAIGRPQFTSTRPAGTSRDR